MYQPSLAFFQEALGWSRKSATILMVSICIVGSFFVMYFSKDGVLQSTIDDWVGTFLIFVLAMIQIIAFSWIFGMKRGWAEAHEGAQIRIPFFYYFIMKYVTPTYLLVVFVAFCKDELGNWVRAVADDPRRQGALALILATIILLVICTRIGAKRWKAAGLDIDGKLPPDDVTGGPR
jgi:hypothetical protein